jgi:ketosteroid isomerase-like protein
MKKYIAAIVLSLSPLLAISQTKEQVQAEKEILQAEVDFAKMANEKGPKAAFLYYSAPEVVILRGKKIYKGKAELEVFYKDATPSDTLTRTADYVNASAGGDMGYTYGKFLFKGKDPSGKPIKGEGYFHTVWKRQPDGEWKFVWD